MGFMQATKKCLRDWITFSGRAQRSEFWWFMLFQLILSFVMQILFGALGFTASNGGGGAMGGVAIILLIVLMVFYLYLAIASISAAVRRLHDKDKSGWWYWIVLIPLVGPILLIVWFCQRGTVGPNQYGEDPLGGVGAEVFE